MLRVGLGGWGQSRTAVGLEARAVLPRLTTVGEMTTPSAGATGRSIIRTSSSAMSSSGWRTVLRPKT